MLLLISATFMSGQQFTTKDLLSSLIDELKGDTASSHKQFQCRKCRYSAWSRIQIQQWSYEKLLINGKHLVIKNYYSKSLYRLRFLCKPDTKGAFVWDQSGIRITRIRRVSICLGTILILECLDFHSGYFTPRSRIAGINSGIYSYSGISQTNAP